MLDISDDPAALPSSPKLSASAFYGLLTDPPGSYGKATYGASTAFTLRGGERFLRLASNLFDSFGGETENGPLDGSAPRWQERREVSFRQGNDKECLFFCMPPERFKKAVYLYLRGKVMEDKGQWRILRDAEGNYLGQDLLNEGDVDREAHDLAQSFCEHEIGLDYRAIPEYVSSAGLTEHCCHGVIVDD